MPDLSLLTESEIALLQSVLDKVRSQRQNTAGRPAVRQEQGQAPEVYLVRTPIAGIPALSAGTNVGTGSLSPADDVPGSALCGVYRLIQTGSGLPGTGQAVGVQPVSGSWASPKQITVYNFLPIAIPGGQWVTAIRDKFGYWLVPAQGLQFGTC
jgi:hypothetical protein